MPILGVDCRGRRGDGRLDEILVLFWVLVGGIAGGGWLTAWVPRMDPVLAVPNESLAATTPYATLNAHI